MIQNQKNQIVPSRSSFLIRLINKLKSLRNNSCKAEYALVNQRVTSQYKYVDAFATVSSEHIQDVNLIFKGFQNFPCLSLYIHGSWADQTKTSFSDLDDLIVVKRDGIKTVREVRKIESWLNRVDMRFCRIDPLQHHGHWIIYEDQLENYDESYMPLLVLENSICLQGEKKISAKVNIEATQVGLERNLKVTLLNIENYYIKYQKNQINLYDMKCLIGSFLLVPAYVFQMKGKRVTKKWAIENASNIYSADVHKVLEICSTMRQDWKKALNTFQFELFSISPKFFTNPHLYRKFAQKFAPKFPCEVFPTLKQKSVDAFIQETKDIINEK
ncbi:hypothetical protein [Picosynechococcus sp. PCC 8807]|uniref:hypothetical protein n=1 Tax=Picosynechococcus sp. PCC 8807 TaxID=195248 RepID=UPI000810611A|nr:hypothetical protein [Picosynechococcus sp. PCC 8807]ANV89539.1 hypothetical protein AWQ24_02175 [Picosynechococcus sp. PCC 8807]